MTGWTAVLAGLGLTAAAAAWGIRWSGRPPSRTADPAITRAAAAVAVRARGRR